MTIPKYVQLLAPMLSMADGEVPRLGDLHDYLTTEPPARGAWHDAH
jgi:hypothetical protein